MGLSIKNVISKYEDNLILDNLNLEIDDFNNVCLLGLSGCGKTTLLKVIAGLHPIEKGQIIFNGKVLSDNNINIPIEERGIGLIFQDYALFPHMTVASNLSYGIEKLKLSKKEKNKIIDEYLDLVRLSEFKNRFPHELSGGQQQRVAIARSLVVKPKVLLLDEPFSNVDTSVRLSMMNEIKCLLKEKKILNILVTHSKEEAFVFSDKIAIMDKGNVVQYGTAENLYNFPNNRFVAEFMGNYNYLRIKIIDYTLASSCIGFISITNIFNNISIGNEYDLLVRPKDIIIKNNDKSDIKIIGKVFLGYTYSYIIEAKDSTKLNVTSVESYNIGDYVNISYCGKFPVLFDVS